MTPNISPPLAGPWNSHLRPQNGAEGPQGATVTLLKTLHSDDRFGIESQGVRKGLQAGLWRHLAGPWGADGIEAT